MQETSKVERVASDCATNADASYRSELIVAKVPQGYETNINVRFVPGRDVEIIPLPRGCAPRGTPGRDAVPLYLSPDLIDKLKGADKTVIKWLAKDEANAQLFMVRPAEALVKAGVDLTRADQKAINRTHNEVRQAAVIGPGVKVSSLTATAYTRGKIGRIKPSVNRENNDNIGCAKEV